MCALLALALTATLIGVRVALSAAGATMLTPSAAKLVTMLLFPEIAGAAMLWVAMWYFWFGFDRSSYLKKALWFPFLLFLVPLATAFYYFLVYRRGARAEAPTASAQSS
jgi:hypothetical protein